MRTMKMQRKPQKRAGLTSLSISMCIYALCVSFKPQFHSNYGKYAQFVASAAKPTSGIDEMCKKISMWVRETFLLLQYLHFSCTAPARKLNRLDLFSCMIFLDFTSHLGGKTFLPYNIEKVFYNGMKNFFMCAKSVGGRESFQC